MKGYTKLYAPIVGLVLMAILTTLQDAYTDQHISVQEYIQLAIQATMVAHVWATANLPQYTRMKFFVAGVIAVLQAFYTLVPGGVDFPEILNMAITFLSAIGVAAVRQPVTVVHNGTTVPPQDRASARPLANGGNFQ